MAVGASADVFSQERRVRRSKFAHTSSQPPQALPLPASRRQPRSPTSNGSSAVGLLGRGGRHFIWKSLVPDGTRVNIEGLIRTKSTWHAGAWRLSGKIVTDTGYLFHTILRLLDHVQGLQMEWSYQRSKFRTAT